MKRETNRNLLKPNFLNYGSRKISGDHKYLELVSWNLHDETHVEKSEDSTVESSFRIPIGQTTGRQSDTNWVKFVLISK